jgi:hypothetical protein
MGKRPGQREGSKSATDLTTVPMGRAPSNEKEPTPSPNTVNTLGLARESHLIHKDDNGEHMIHMDDNGERLVCHNCGICNTPQWRMGPTGARLSLHP